MKTPLRYQITEFDCGTVSLLNAISYLYERDEIPSELIRAVYAFTLNCHDKMGIMDDENLIKSLCKWITDYSKHNNEFNLKCEYLTNEKVTYESIEKCVHNKGVAFVRCYQIEPHYIIITHINEQNAYIFDPYYVDYNYYDDDNEIRIIQSKIFEYNRIVNTKRIFSEENKEFSMGKISNRECVLMSKIK